MYVIVYICILFGGKWSVKKFKILIGFYVSTINTVGNKIQKFQKYLEKFIFKIYY